LSAVTINVNLSLSYYPFHFILNLKQSVISDPQELTLDADQPPYYSLVSSSAVVSL